MFKNITIAIVIFSSFMPAITNAADINVSGWIPYWKISDGLDDAEEHFDKLTSVYPFSFTVTSEAKLKDQAKMSSREWKKFIKSAKADDIEVIPTVMWSDTSNITIILTDTNKRTNLVKNISKMVKSGKYDGVDIDFEGKRAETKDNFSKFLKELNKELGTKTLVCTIEARTPPDSLYRDIPRVINYANDYKVIGSVCDRVNIMTYDQQRADIELNSSNVGSPYFPVADVKWVEKVAKLAIQSIPKSKISLGVATYGRENAVKVLPEQFESYNGVGAINHIDAVKLAEKNGITPARNKAGELEFTYFPDSATRELVLGKKAKPASDPYYASNKALAYAGRTGNTVFVHHVTWSDGEAIRDKIELAEDLGLAGIAIFKLDGGGDTDLWDHLDAIGK